MPQYRVRDSKTGKRSTIEWDGPNPPTPEDVKTVLSGGLVLKPEQYGGKPAPEEGADMETHAGGSSAMNTFLENVGDVPGGIMSSIARTVYGGGDWIRRGLGMERIYDEPEVKEAMTAPNTWGGTIGSVGGDVAQFAIPGSNVTKAAKGLSLAGRLGVEGLMGAGIGVLQNPEEPGKAAMYGGGAGIIAPPVAGYIGRKAAPIVRSLFGRGGSEAAEAAAEAAAKAESARVNREAADTLLGKYPSSEWQAENLMVGPGASKSTQEGAATLFGPPKPGMTERDAINMMTGGRGPHASDIEGANILFGAEPTPPPPWVPRPMTNDEAADILTGPRQLPPDYTLPQSPWSPPTQRAARQLPPAAASAGGRFLGAEGRAPIDVTAPLPGAAQAEVLAGSGQTEAARRITENARPVRGQAGRFRARTPEEALSLPPETGAPPFADLPAEQQAPYLDWLGRDTPVPAPPIPTAAAGLSDSDYMSFLRERAGNVPEPIRNPSTTTTARSGVPTSEYVGQPDYTPKVPSPRATPREMALTDLENSVLGRTGQEAAEGVGRGIEAPSLAPPPMPDVPAPSPAMGIDIPPDKMTAVKEASKQLGRDLSAAEIDTIVKGPVVPPPPDKTTPWNRLFTKEGTTSDVPSTVEPTAELPAVPSPETPTVYHGTSGPDFEHFKPEGGNPFGNFPEWNHFTENPEYSGMYSLGEALGKKRNIPQGAAGARTIAAKGQPQKVLDITQPLSDADRKIIDEASKKFFSGSPPVSQENALEIVRAIYKDLPYDAIKFGEHGQTNWAFKQGVKLKTPQGVPLTKFGPETGAVGKELGRHITGGTIGGVFGGMHGETSEERWRNAAIGAAVGAGASIAPTLGRTGGSRGTFKTNPPITQPKASLFTPTGRARLKKEAIDALNVPRSVMASVDLSAPLRQGATMIHKKEYWKAVPQMVKAFASEDSFGALQREIASRPTFGAMQKAGLALSDLGKTAGEAAQREELFMSRLAEKIPGLGRAIRASGRGYVGFLNKLRADSFDSLIQAAPEGTSAKEIASYVNNATGRGGLGGFEGAAPLLNAALFSPRLMTSRLAMLNPMTYAKASPFVRKEYIKSMAAFGGAVGTTLKLAEMNGAEVELDPRSSDFAKIKMGDMRVDIGAGFQQYIRAASQIATGERKDLLTGRIKTLGKKYRDPTRKDVAFDFMEAKASPILGLMFDMMEGRDFTGKPTKLLPEREEGKLPTRKEFFDSQLGRRLTPMLLQDFYDVYDEDPSKLGVMAPAFFGASVQVHEPRLKRHPQ